MAKKRVLIQAVILLTVVWVVVIGVRAVAGSKRVTTEKVAEVIAASNFEDWSEGVPDGALLTSRDAQLVEVANMINKLDFGEREKAQENRVGEGFFRRLAPPEKEKFVKLTVAKTMETMLRALDGMPAEERRRVVEDGLRDIESGRTEDEMERARELSDELLNQITSEGMRAYFEETSAETKIDLAPLVEAMDSVVKGMRGHEFGPPK
jgi:hypothetical protein